METRRRKRAREEEQQQAGETAAAPSSSSRSSSSSSSSAPPPFRGPAADSLLGERLIDVIGIVAAMGFAAEVAHCLYLCGETWRKGDKGATNDMIARSMEKQGWAALLRESRAAKRDKRGMTQLMRAARSNNLPRVLQLLQLGAPLELRSGGGFTALHFACAHGHERIAKALLDGKYEGRGAEVDALTNGGYTPLMYASLKGHEGVVRLLLARVAKVAARNKYGSSPLSYATNNGQAACAALLRAHGATS